MTEEATSPAEQSKEPPGKPRLRHPRFQYSISTLLLLTAVLALWLGHVTNRVRKQREAVKALSAIGATISYDWEFGDGDGLMIMEPEPPGPEWLRKLIGDEYFQEVEEIYLSDLSQPIDYYDQKDLVFGESDESFGLDEEEFILTEEHLNHLKSFSQLRSLDIDAACRSLPPGFWKAVRHLDYLSVYDYCDSDNDGFGDQELYGIGELQELETLTLISAGISGAALKYIGELRKLEELRITCSEVVDNDLVFLKNLESLYVLSISVDNEKKHIEGHGLKHLPSGLKRLGLNGLSNDAGFKYLRHLQSLYALSIETDLVTNEGLLAISHLKTIRELAIYSQDYSGCDWGSLDTLEHLQKLELLGVCLRGRDIAKLGRLPALTHLTLGCEGFTNEDMKSFEKLKSVTNLTLLSSVSERSLMNLKKMPKLQSVDFQTGTDLDPSAKMRIEKCLQGINIEWGN